MVKNHRKTKNTNSPKNVAGDIILLNIRKKLKSLNISVTNISFKTSVYAWCIMWLLVIFIVLTSCLFNVLNIKYSIILAILFSIYIILYQMCKIVREENLVIIKGLGIQLTTKYVKGFKSEFIPEESVQTIFINEVIYRQKILYVLMLLTKEANTKQRLIPLLFGVQPRLSCLELIYKNIEELR